MIPKFIDRKLLLTMDEFTISEVFTSEGVRPIIINFQNGLLQDGSISAELYTNSKGKRVVGAVEDKIVYSGELDRNESFDNYLVAIDKRTRKARLIAVDHTKLSPDISGKQTTVANSTPMELHKQFGSKRSKMLLEQRERLKKNVENAKEQLEKTVANLTIDENFSFAKVDDEDNSYKPPINREAERVEQVYELKTLIPKDVLRAVQNEGIPILESDEDKLGLAKIIKKYITKANSDTKKLSVLLYINSLLKFLSASARVIGTKKFAACDYSQTVNTNILENFCLMGKFGRTRPNSMRDKALCYIVVLLAIVNDYKLDLAEIALETKMKLKKIQDVVRVLLFTFTDREKMLAALQLPLPNPVAVLGKRRGK